MTWTLTVNLRSLAANGMSEPEALAAGAVIDKGHAIFTGPGDGYSRAMALMKRKLPVPWEPGRRVGQDDPAWAERKARQLAIVGPKLWSDLHRWALTADLATADAWLKGFCGRVPCGDCRRHWRKMMEATPPDLSSRDALFVWSVNRHNEVNAKLGKPAMTVEAARAVWSAL